MWFTKPPSTPEERAGEIQRLERQRDRLLADAPKHFYFRRLLLPLMLVPALIAVMSAVFKHHAKLTLAHGLILAVFLLIVGQGVWKVWRRTPRDKWGFSDALGYEGDSPRDIQKKIDALRRDA